VCDWIIVILLLWLLKTKIINIKLWKKKKKKKTKKLLNDNNKKMKRKFYKINLK